MLLQPRDGGINAVLSEIPRLCLRDTIIAGIALARHAMLATRGPALDGRRLALAFVATRDSVDSMATLSIRQLDEKTKTRLRVRAGHHGRSMEEERIIVGRIVGWLRKALVGGTGKLLLGVYFARFVNAIGRSPWGGLRRAAVRIRRMSSPRSWRARRNVFRWIPNLAAALH